MAASLLLPGIARAQKVAPVVSTAPHNGDNVDPALCIADCFDGTVSYAAPAYVSMNTPRSVTLLYRSSQAKPTPVIQVDATDNSSPASNKMSIKLKRSNGTYVTFTNGLTETFFQSAVGPNRLAAQFDAASLATGFYDYTAEVRSYWTDGTVLMSSAAIRVLVNNENASRFGAGWTVAGLQRLIRSGPAALVVEGTGAARYFVRNACTATAPTCTYVSPRGDYTALSMIREFNARTGAVVDSEYYRVYPDGMRAAFRGDGLLSSVNDRFNNRSWFLYDASNRLQTITDPAGKVVTFGYNATTGKLLTIQDSGGRTTTVTVDAAGDLIRIDDPAGGTTLQAWYTSEHLLYTYADRRGGAWDLNYDSAKRLQRRITPFVTADGSLQRLVTTFESTQTVILSPFGGGSSTNPLPRRIPADLRARTWNTRGFPTAFALDRFGSATRIEEPYGRVSLIARDDSGRIAQTISPAGDTADFTWTKSNITQARTRATNNAPAKIVTLTYESTYNELATVAGDADSLWNYWSAGRLDSIRVGKSSRAVTKFRYDTRGRDTLVTDPEGHEARTSYAASGWMNTDSVRVGVSGSYRRTAFTYDGYGRTATTKDPRNRVTAMLYDGLNRVTRVVGPPLGDTIIYSYDALFPTSLKDAKGQLYKFMPNALGWFESDTFPVPTGVSAGRRYTYDAAGNVTSVVNRRGQTVSFTYDSLGNQLTRTADGQTATYKVDPLSRFASASNAESTDTVKFDALGRSVVEIAMRAGTRYELASTYNVRDLRTMLRIVTPWADTVRFAYSGAMELDTLQDVAGGLTKLKSDNHQLPIEIRLPNGVTITQGFPSVHTPSGVTYSASAVNSRIGVQFSFDDLGLVEARLKAALDSGRVFEYDSLARLTRAADFRMSASTCQITAEGTRCPHPDEIEYRVLAYSFDRAGNRTDLGAVTSAGNRVVKFNGDSLVYDVDGNLIRRIRNGVDIQRLYWNSVGELVAAWTNGQSPDSVSFAYDAQGRRARKWTASGTTRFLWDGDDLFAEVDGSGNRVAEYTYYPGIDRPHSVRRGGAAGATYYYATDYPGNVVGLLDAAGAVVKEYRYGPWGDVELESGSLPNALRFGAREYDSETGLYYNRARYYDATLGRFISEDRIGLIGGLNSYVYAANNPVNKADALGLSECEEGKTLKAFYMSDGSVVYRCSGSGGSQGQQTSITGVRDAPASGGAPTFGGTAVLGGPTNFNFPADGRGWGGGGSSRCFPTDRCGLHSLIHYDPKYARGTYKKDPRHNFPTDRDLLIILTGKVLDRGPNGYAIYGLRDKYWSAKDGQWVWGWYEIGAEPYREGGLLTGGFFVKHRFFNERRP